MSTPTAFQLATSLAPCWPLGADTVAHFSLVGKRLIDLSGALVLLVLLSPVLFVAAVAIKLTSVGPVFFTQKRVGFGCRPFSMYKFRTMVPGSERSESLLAERRPGRTFVKVFDDPRVTPLGRWLRKYSVDELPQLWNVLRGEMSLVGPRPILLADFHHFPLREQMRRFSMLPGMTGLWQVSGRSQTSDERRMVLDLSYVDRWNLGLDLVILGRTIPVVIHATGAV